MGMEEAGSPMDDLPFQKVCELLKLLQETCGKNAKDRRRRLLDRFHLKLIPPGRWEARPAWPFQRVASGRLPSQPVPLRSPLPASRTDANARGIVPRGPSVVRGHPVLLLAASAPAMRLSVPRAA